MQGLEIRFPSVDQLPGSRVKLIQNVLHVCVVISVGAGRAERNGMKKKKKQQKNINEQDKTKKKKKSHFVFSRKNIFIMPRIMEQPREKERKRILNRPFLLIIYIDWRIGYYIQVALHMIR